MTKRTTLVLSDVLIKRIKQRALDENTTMTEVMVNAFEQYLTRIPFKPDSKAPLGSIMNPITPEKMAALGTDFEREKYEE